MRSDYWFGACLAVAIVAATIDYGLLLFSTKPPSARRTFAHAILWASPMFAIVIAFQWSGQESGEGPAVLPAIIPALVLQVLTASVMTISVFRSRQSVNRWRNMRGKHEQFPEN